MWRRADAAGTEEFLAGEEKLVSRSLRRIFGTWRQILSRHVEPTRKERL